MQNERGTPRTLQHQLTCKDEISKSFPSPCTACTSFWSRTRSHTSPRTEGFLVFLMLQTPCYLFYFLTLFITFIQSECIWLPSFSKIPTQLIFSFTLLSVSDSGLCVTDQARAELVCAACFVTVRVKGAPVYQHTNLPLFALLHFPLSHQHNATCDYCSVRKCLRSPSLTFISVSLMRWAAVQWCKLWALDDVWTRRQILQRDGRNNEEREMSSSSTYYLTYLFIFFLFSLYLFIPV